MWDWLFAFIDPLERLSIPYALVGSVAASIYGEPRATNDVDVVIQVKASDVPRLIAAYPADQFYLPPEEVMAAELERTEGGHLNIIALDVMAKADLYPLPAGQQTWFARRRSLAVAGRALWVAAPEVVILQKLLFFREGRSEKHLRDIRGMVAVSGSQLDAPWLQGEVARLHLADEWRLVSGPGIS
ncbi:MAG: hypothetical protein HYV95_13235 [Opitutae bacterium]|nr:hypothetical protein [Opitutae bacterium]